jgi:hypothetical protein
LYTIRNIPMLDLEDGSYVSREVNLLEVGVEFVQRGRGVLKLSLNEVRHRLHRRVVFGSTYR